MESMSRKGTAWEHECGRHGLSRGSSTFNVDNRPAGQRLAREVSDASQPALVVD